MNPSTVSFQDANPTTTPFVPGNRTIRVRVRVRNAAPTDVWSVNAMAGGDLVSGPHAIPISNTSWTVSQAGGACACSCQVGTVSSAVPQSMLVGQGNTGRRDVNCRQNYRLINEWSYHPGSYTQMMTITVTSP